ncbi:polysialyltransferase family glycosyltransferase [Idiomarina abyssalis]|uniref:polysialyltransferase family glycosyltransferase n=1 Tax=Idiomarina abyssalis TaxID=86102 RepID=UPI003A8CC8CA
MSNSTKITTTEVQNALARIEEELSLFDFEIEGVKVWLALRLHIYYELCEKLGVLDTPHRRRLTLKEKFFRPFITVFNSIFRNPFFAKKSRYLLVPHNRKVKTDSGLIDIYTDDLEKEIGDELVIVEKHDGISHQRSLCGRRYAYDFISLYTIIASRLRRLNSGSHSAIVYQIERRIESEFKVQLTLHSKFERYAYKHNCESWLLRKLLLSKGVKEVFLVVSYGNPPLVDACRKLQVTTTEIQHGVINQFHIGYDFGEKANSFYHPYMPNKLILWNELWRHGAKLPKSIEKIEVKEPSYFKRQRQKVEHIQEKKNRILFISQGVNGRQQASLIAKNISALSSYEIIFKLHPSEYKRWSGYSEMVAISKLTNVTVIDNSERDLYELIKSSKYVVGVFSTALFEAIGLEKKVFVWNLPGHEYMQASIESGKAILVPTSEPLCNFLEY